MSVKKGLLLIVGILLAAAIAFGVCFAVPVFKVGNYEVTGLGQTTQEEVEQSTGLTMGDNLVRVSSQEVASNVSKLPWVNKVSVNISLPSTVNVAIEERTAKLFITRNDGDHLVDTQGNVFVIQPAPEGTKRVTGLPDDDPQGFKDILTLMDALGKRTEQIKEFDAPSRFEISAVLNDDRRIYFGSADNAEDKAVTFDYAIERGEPSIDISGAPVIAVRP